MNSYEINLKDEDKNYFYFEIPEHIQKLVIENNYKKAYITFLDNAGDTNG